MNGLANQTCYIKTKENILYKVELLKSLMENESLKMYQEC